MDVEAAAASASYQLAQRKLNGQVVWCWQLLADLEDTRQPRWLEGRQALFLHGGRSLTEHRLSRGAKNFDKIVDGRGHDKSGLRKALSASEQSFKKAWPSHRT